MQTLIPWVWEGPRVCVSSKPQMMVLLLVPRVHWASGTKDSGSQVQLHFVKVLVAQLHLTLCDPMDYSPPGSSVHGILQARLLEWVAIASSRGSSKEIKKILRPESHPRGCGLNNAVCGPGTGMFLSCLSGPGTSQG